MPDDTSDRRVQNALLTRAQRQFLVDQENYFTGENAPQMRAEKRRGIVDRVRHGLRDFRLLFEHLRPAELEAIFRPDGEDAPGLDSAVRSAIAVLFLGVADDISLRTEAKGTAANVEGGHVSRAFETALEDGLRLGYRQRGYLLESARLDVSSQGPIEDLDRLLEKLEAGTASKEEVLYVIQSLDIPTGSIQQALHEAMDEHSGSGGQ